MAALFNATSTASSPAVKYSVDYSVIRNGRNADITFIISSRLNYTSSKLGSGAKLTAIIRVGTVSKEVVIKSPTDVWTGTTAHTSSATVTIESAESEIEVSFEVTRKGSNISGSAGSLSASSHTAQLPPYNAYHVTYSVGGNIPAGYSAPTDSTSYSSGQTVTVKPQPTAEGYTFSGWSKDGETVASFTVTANTTLYGVWSAVNQSNIYTKYQGQIKQPKVYTKHQGQIKQPKIHAKYQGRIMEVM